jgi:hypothetical protein
MHDKNKIPNMTAKLVFAEPGFWELLSRLSKIHGTRKPQAGSMSEALRRFAKSGMVKINPNLQNVTGINWTEKY